MKNVIIFILFYSISFNTFAQYKKRLEYYHNYCLTYRVNKYESDSITMYVHKKKGGALADFHEFIQNIGKEILQKQPRYSTGVFIAWYNNIPSILYLDVYDTIQVVNDTLDLYHKIPFERYGMKVLHPDLDTTALNHHKKYEIVKWQHYWAASKPIDIYPFLKEMGNDSSSCYYWINHDEPTNRHKIGRMVGSYYLYDNPNYKVFKYEMYDVFKQDNVKTGVTYKQPELIGRFQFCPKLGYIGIYVYERGKLLAQRKLMSINDIPLKDFIAQDTCITPFCHFGE